MPPPAFVMGCDPSLSSVGVPLSTMNFSSAAQKINFVNGTSLCVDSSMLNQNPDSSWLGNASSSLVEAIAEQLTDLA